MKTRLLMVSLAIAVVALSTACKDESTAPATATTASPGKVIYDQQCSICHGKTGKGDTMIASSYAHSNLTDSEWGYGGTRADLIKTVTEGVPKTPMRGFKGALSEKEIEQVVEYVLALSGS